MSTERLPGSPYMHPGATMRQAERYYGWLDPEPEPDDDRKEDEE